MSGVASCPENFRKLNSNPNSDLEGLLGQKLGKIEGRWSDTGAHARKLQCRPSSLFVFLLLFVLGTCQSDGRSAKTAQNTTDPSMARSYACFATGSRCLERWAGTPSVDSPPQSNCSIHMKIGLQQGRWRQYQCWQQGQEEHQGEPEASTLAKSAN